MRTKEDLMKEDILQPTDMSTNEAFNADVKMTMLEVLIDIRDILDKTFKDHGSGRTLRVLAKRIYQ